MALPRAAPGARLKETVMGGIVLMVDGEGLGSGFEMGEGAERNSVAFRGAGGTGVTEAPLLEAAEEVFAVSAFTARRACWRME